MLMLPLPPIAHLLLLPCVRLALQLREVLLFAGVEVLLFWIVFVSLRRLWSCSLAACMFAQSVRIHSKRACSLKACVCAQSVSTEVSLPCE